MNIPELEKAHGINISIINQQLIISQKDRELKLSLPKNLNQGFLNRAIKKFLKISKEG